MGAAVEPFLDLPNDRCLDCGSPDFTGWVMGRLCDTQFMTDVSDSVPLDLEEVTYTSMDQDASVLGAISISPGGFSVTAQSSTTGMLTLQCPGCLFELHQPYVISSGSPGMINVYYGIDGRTDLLGFGTSGTLQFDSCEIVTRGNLDNEPLMVLVGGTVIGGQLWIMDLGPPIIDTTERYSDFSFFLVADSTGVGEQLDSLCWGGRER
jgi:hypothetical protein